MDPYSTIYVAGGDTLLGSALLQYLHRHGYRDLIGWPGQDPDFSAPGHVDMFFARKQPEFVVVAAGLAGGIAANLSRPAELMLHNLQVACSIAAAAHRHPVRKLLYLASSCSYPRLAEQPMRVEALMTGLLEPTNEAYATAKLAGLTLFRALRSQYGEHFITAIPANAYGPGDDFSPEDSHVVAALIRRIEAARCAGAPHVEIWGTGTPRREFIFADDVAVACTFLLEHYDEPVPINIGTGTSYSIRELAEIIRAQCGYEGELRFNESRPDGMPLKALDSTPLRALGWTPATSIVDGIQATLAWYRDHPVLATSADAPPATPGSACAQRYLQTNCASGR